MGEAARYLRVTLINSILITLSFCISVSFGIIALAWTFSILTCILQIPSIIYLMKPSPVTPRDFFDQIWVPLGISLVSGVVALLASQFFVFPLPVVGLIFKAFVFFTVYIALGSQTKGGQALYNHLVHKTFLARFSTSQT